MSIDDSGARQRFPTLDAMRGAAAIAVLLYHLRNLSAPGRPSAFEHLFASGYLAVDLFFLLSGFVIAHAYGRRLREAMTFRRFMMVRFIRLQPIIAIGTLMGFSLALIQTVFRLEQAPGLFAIVTGLPANLLMLPNILVPWGMFLFNPPAWSLFYELLANAVYALGLSRSRGPSTGRSIILLSICTAAGFVGLVLSVMEAGDLDHGVTLADWPIALSRIVFSFPLGILLYDTRHRWMHHVPRLPTSLPVAICLALLATDFSGHWRAIYDLLFVAITSPILVMTGASTRSPSNYSRNLALLGSMSYPLYGTHAPIKHIIEQTTNYTFIITFAISSIISITLSFILIKMDAAWQIMLHDRMQRGFARLSSSACSPARERA